MRLTGSITLATLGSIGFWGVVVILPEVQSEFSLSRAAASIPYTLTMVGFAAGNVLFGRYVDRWGIVKPIIIAAIAMALGHVGASMSSGIWSFALIQRRSMVPVL